MTKILPILYVVIGAIVCFLVMRQCSAKPPLPDNTANQKYIDSLVKLNRDSAVLPYKDSIAVKDKKIDSLQIIVNTDRYSGLVKENEIVGLISDLQRLKEQKDTIGQLAACDSLRISAEQGLALVKQVTKDRDNLDSAYRAKIGLQDSATSRLYGMYNSASNALFQCGLKYDQLSALYKKFNIPAKHWSVGPSAGVTVFDGKLAPFVGIGVTYSIIKF